MNECKRIKNARSSMDAQNYINFGVDRRGLEERSTRDDIKGNFDDIEHSINGYTNIFG